jgi:soluble lytic murein transglycosylase
VVAAIAVSACLLAGGEAARAQIYMSHDESGAIVLSDRPITGAATYRVYPVARSASIVTTRPPAVSDTGGYDQLIEHHASANRVRADLVRAVIQVESGYNRYARSPKGAMGLMQLMPSTAAELGVTDPYDPAQNIAGGVTYLRGLLERFNYNEELALAAYNAGPSAVDRYGQRVPPYRETRDYVQKVKGRTSVAARRPPRSTIYKIVEYVDGRAVVRYTNVRPAAGYEVVPMNSQPITIAAGPEGR